jgi:hypothetical protein
LKTIVCSRGTILQKANGQKLLHRYSRKIWGVEGADRERGPDCSAAAERIEIVTAWNYGVAQHEHVDITASADALDRVPDVSTDAGRLISDDQNLAAVDSLELHRLDGRDALMYWRR